MLNIHFFTFNPFQENTYIISNEKKECWIVDPGMYGDNETNELTGFISSNQFTPKAIINTHTHLDHIFGVNALKAKYSIPFGIHQDDLPVLQRGADTAALFGFQLTDVPEYDFFIKNGEPLMLADDEVEVFLTPGHSPGSISFYYPKGAWVVAGDVLFNGSIGRADLPGGNFDTLTRSIRTHLFSLPDNTVVFSGHGPETTIGNEKKYNPFLK